MGDTIFVFMIIGFMIILLCIVASWCIDKAYELGYKHGIIDGFEMRESNKGD